MTNDKFSYFYEILAKLLDYILVLDDIKNQDYYGARNVCWNALLVDR